MKTLVKCLLIVVLVFVFLSIPFAPVRPVEGAPILTTPVSVYQSEWIEARPDYPIVIKHYQGSLPITVQIFVALAVDTFDQVIPYQERDCLSIGSITTKYIYFYNTCGSTVYIQASAIFKP